MDGDRAYMGGTQQLEGLPGQPNPTDGIRMATARKIPRAPPVWNVPVARWRRLSRRGRGGHGWTGVRSAQMLITASTKSSLLPHPRRTRVQLRSGTPIVHKGPLHAPAGDNSLGEQQWLVCQEHIPLQEAHKRRAVSSATRRNGSVVANDVADAVDQEDGDQFGAFGGGPGPGKLVVWDRQHVQRYFMFSRPCGIVIFSEFLERGEGPATVLASTAKALRCLPHPLSAVAYDMACRILQHIEGGAADPGAAAAVEGVALVVLRFH